MKKITCEMCGGNEFIKEDGLFVCQSCGTKYSAEEAKKMMVEVEGAVEVKNLAQIEGLLKLAESSIESENYAVAEENCNTVISIDPANYAAWCLKARAINYQINASNPRILEVCNCLMTAYDSLPEEQKEEKKTEIFDLANQYLSEEISYWIHQVENNRPSDKTVRDAQNALEKSISLINTVCDKLGLEEKGKICTLAMENFFIDVALKTTVSAWNTTVAYNYFRKGFKSCDLAIGMWRQTTEAISVYHPMHETWTTFYDETAALTKLLRYCEGIYNPVTDIVTKYCLCLSIQGMNNELNKSVYFDPMVSTTTNGYGVVVSKREYWEEHTDYRRGTGRRVSAEYKEKSKALEKEYSDTYWDAKPGERDVLKGVLDGLLADRSALEAELQPTLDSYNAIMAKKEVPVEAAKEIGRLNDEISAKTEALGKLVFFKLKEKKALNAELEVLAEKLRNAEAEEKKQCAERDSKADEEAAPFKSVKDEKEAKMAELEEKIKNLQNELYGVHQISMPIEDWNTRIVSGWE